MDRDPNLSSPIFIMTNSCVTCDLEIMNTCFFFLFKRKKDCFYFREDFSLSIEIFSRLRGMEGRIY